MIALNGPRLGRLPILSSLSFSSCEIFFRFTESDEVTLDVKAGTAERWARIFADVS